MEVEEKDAELFIRKAKREGKLIRNLRSLKENGKVIIPVRERVEFKSALLCEREFSRKEDVTIPDVINSIMKDNNRKIRWQRMGSTVIFSSEYEELERVSKELVKKSIATQVYLRDGRIEGEVRRPRLRLIAGIQGDTQYLENGVTFITSPARLMMSKGNIVERGLPSIKKISAGTVLDMFAGIGYFSLPIAKLKTVKNVTCIDLNIEALEYLEKSAALNGVKEKITTYNMDCRLFNAQEKYDLVIMGNFKSRIYLASGLSHVAKNGYILLHHLELTGNIKLSVYDLMKSARYLGYSLMPVDSHIVKSYSPHVWHISSLFQVL